MTLDQTSQAAVKAEARGNRPSNRPRPDSAALLTDVMVRATAKPTPDADKYEDVPCTD